MGVSIASLRRVHAYVCVCIYIYVLFAYLLICLSIDRERCIQTFTTEYEHCTLYCYCCQGATSELAAGASAVAGSSTSSSGCGAERALNAWMLRQLPFPEPQPRRKRHSSAPETSRSHLQGRVTITVVITDLPSRPQPCLRP